MISDRKRTDGTENESRLGLVKQLHHGMTQMNAASPPKCVASGADRRHLTNKPTSVNTTPACVKERLRGTHRI